MAPAARGRALKYKTQRVIGRGAFGTAYLVRSHADSRLYVMKKLSLEHMSKKEREDATNECTVMMKLRRHPNVIRVHEYFEEANVLHIVMDFADGGDLAQRIEAQAASKTPFAEAQVLNWFVQICLALKHAHDRKVLHRDLKPQNIFLTRMNLVRLGDFGISKVLNGTMSVANTCVGTPLYLAPELCEGKEYGNKCDVWSIGVILYELFALQTPFTARVMPALVMRICGSEPPPLPELFSRQSRELTFELLIKDPARRPRVHDVLERDFIKSRIESFLDPKLLQEEFSHTLFHNSPSPAAPPRATSAAPAGTRRNTRLQAGPSTKAGAGNKKSGAGGAPPRMGAAVSSALAGGLDQQTRRQIRAEAEHRREATREQIRRDRRAKAVRDEPGVEILLPATVQGGFPSEEEDTLGEPASDPASGRPRSTPSAPAASGGGCESKRAEIQAAHPGSRMLSDEEVAESKARLMQRQAELKADLEGSVLGGEAGRRYVNDLQRQLFSIERTLGALDKQYILVDEFSGGAEVLAGELDAHISEEVMIDGDLEMRASTPPSNVAVIACSIEDEVVDDLLEDELDTEEGRVQTELIPEEDSARLVDEYTRDASVVLSEATTASVPEEHDRSVAEQEPARPIASERPAAVAWSISMESTPPPSEPQVNRKPSMGTGGIAFEIAFDDPPSRPSRKKSGTPGASNKAGRAAPASAALAPPAPTRDIRSSFEEHAEPGLLPQNIYVPGSSLPNKVETLRMYLEEALGGEDVFKRVYGYVLRDENGECEDVEEKEALHAYLGPQRKRLVPLVYTLAYMEDALSACGIAA